MSFVSANPGVGGNNNPADKHPAFPGLDFDSKTTEWNPGDKAVYKANDINNRQKTEYFVNVEGADKIKKQAEKQERLKREQIKKELDEEERKQAEAERARGRLGQQEQRQANREMAKANNAKIRQTIARHKMPIIVATLVIAIVAAAVIILPKLNASIATEKNNKFISENGTPILDVYREVVGKELNKDQINAILSKYKEANIVADFYEEACVIHYSGSNQEKIKSISEKKNSGIFVDFVYSYTGEETIVILEEYDGYKYYRGESERVYGDIEEAINASILDKRGQKND